MIKLLIADDEKIERDALRFIVQKGCAAVDEIEEAGNGKEAFDMSLRFRPDIVFLDIKMPGINGIDAAKQIRNLLPLARIVFLTAYNFFDHAHEAIKLGADDFIVKPASDERVEEVLNRLTLELHREETEKNTRIMNETKLEKAFECLEFELIGDLRTGRLTPAKMERFPEVMDFHFSDLLAGVLSFDFLSYPMKVGTAAQKGILKKKCLTRLKSILRNRDIRVFAEDLPEEDLNLLFLPPSEGYPENIHEELRRITESVSREFSIKLHLGVSAPFSTAEESFAAYSKAKRAAYEGRASGEAGHDGDTWRGPIEKAKRFIEIHYSEDISLERVAAEVNLSPFYFSKLFKSRNRVSFSDFIARTRIERAKELLSRHPYSLKEVSAMVGYTDPNYFTRVFRRIEGVTPSRYREEMNPGVN